MTPEQKEYCLLAYSTLNKTPRDIQKDLGLKHFQPVYLYLHKMGVFEPGKNAARRRRKYCLNERFFETIDSEDKAYCLGFITADGHVDQSCNRVKIALNRKDLDILKKMSEALGSNSPIADIPSKNQAAVSFNSVAMVKDLVEKGLSSNKSLTMTSEVWSHVPEDLKRHFLRGYFDGDGCISLGKRYSSGVKYLVQVIGTEEFLQGTFDVFYPTSCKLYKYTTCDMYCWKVSSKQGCIEFLSKLYEGATIYLDRKFAQYSECAHVKPRELSGSPNGNAEGNQQPSTS